MVGVLCLLLLLPPALTQIRQRNQRFGDTSHRWPGVGGDSSSFALHMGKGFHSAKQVALAKKLQQAKSQHKNIDPDAQAQHDKVESSDNSEQDEEELKMREEFGRLLANNLPRAEEPLQRTSLPPPKRSTDKNKKAGPKLKARTVKKRKKQKESTNSVPEERPEEILLRVGDMARRIDFESLVQVDSLQPLGPIEAAKLVPWVPPYLTEYLVILADPRRQSNDLRSTIQYLHSSPLLSHKVQAIAILADDLGELKAWISRAQWGDKIPIFVDPSLEWITKYGCINSDRWSTHIIVVNSDGVIIEHVEKVNPSHATQILTNVLSS